MGMLTNKAVYSALQCLFSFLTGDKWEWLLRISLTNDRNTTEHCKRLSLNSGKARRTKMKMVSSRVIQIRKVIQLQSSLTWTEPQRQCHSCQLDSSQEVSRGASQEASHEPTCQCRKSCIPEFGIWVSQLPNISHLAEPVDEVLKRRSGEIIQEQKQYPLQDIKDEEAHSAPNTWNSYTLSLCPQRIRGGSRDKMLHILEEMNS